MPDHLVIWSPEKTARALNSTVQTLAKWRHQAKGPPFLKIENKVGYDPQAVASYVGERRFSSTSEARKASRGRYDRA